LRYSKSDLCSNVNGKLRQDILEIAEMNIRSQTAFFRQKKKIKDTAAALISPIINCTIFETMCREPSKAHSRVSFVTIQNIYIL
jgi:hypothetical protein